MDPRKNPYAPGAGTFPPELAGRDEIIERAAIALDRIRDGLSARSCILYGLRGVGKTVLLNVIRLDAEARGFYCIHIEAPESRSLPAQLVPTLRALLLRMSAKEKLKKLAERGLAALAGFAKALKVTYQDIDVIVDFPFERGLADSGDLEFDLKDLFGAMAAAAKENKTAVVLFVDELQYVAEPQLEALITALHDASQKRLPIALVAAGLPQLLGKMGKAKSYSERLFDYVMIDRLPIAAATEALIAPVENSNVTYEKKAVEEILEKTQCYPYFLQEWGRHVWNIAEGSTITYDDAILATPSALAELDNGFFRVRFDRLTPKERLYVRAMAKLGDGPHRSGDIADMMGEDVTSVAPTRNNIIKKGVLYSPDHGDVAFTVPMFGGFLKRTLPE
jgi:AAA ATPase domain